MSNWIIPSPAWSTEMRLIMDLLGKSMNEAWPILKQYGSAEKAIDALA